MDGDSSLTKYVDVSKKGMTHVHTPRMVIGKDVNVIHVDYTPFLCILLRQM